MWEIPWYSRWRSSLFLFLGISWGNTKFEQRSGQWVGESLLAGRIAGEGKGGDSSISPTRSSLRRSIFAFPQLIQRNRKRLLAVYDTRKPALSVPAKCGSKIRDFRRAFPVTLFTLNSPDPQLQFLRQESLVKIKTKYQHCQLSTSSRIVQKLWGLQVSCKVK